MTRTITLLATAPNPGPQPTPHFTSDPLDAIPYAVATVILVAVVALILILRTKDTQKAKAKIGPSLAAAVVLGMAVFALAGTFQVMAGLRTYEDKIPTWQAKTITWLAAEYGIHVDKKGIETLSTGQALVVTFRGKPVPITLVDGNAPDVLYVSTTGGLLPATPAGGADAHR